MRLLYPMRGVQLPQRQAGHVREMSQEKGPEDIRPLIVYMFG